MTYHWISSWHWLIFKYLKKVFEKWSLSPTLFIQKLVDRENWKQFHLSNFKLFGRKRRKRQKTSKMSRTSKAMKFYQSIERRMSCRKCRSCRKKISFRSKNVCRPFDRRVNVNVELILTDNESRKTQQTKN